MWDFEFLRREGEKENEERMDIDWEKIRKMEPEEAVIRVSALAMKERTKKQMRRVWDQLSQFLEEYDMKDTFQSSPDKVVCLWLQHYFRENPKVRRVTTLYQKTRLVQAELPTMRILEGV